MEDVWIYCELRARTVHPRGLSEPWKLEPGARSAEPGPWRLYRSGQIIGTITMITTITSAVSGSPATTKSRKRYFPGP